MSEATEPVAYGQGAASFSLTYVHEAFHDRVIDVMPTKDDPLTRLRIGALLRELLTEDEDWKNAEEERGELTRVLREAQFRAMAGLDKPMR